MTVAELCDYCKETDSCKDCRYTYLCRIFQEAIVTLEPYELKEFMEKELNK